MPFTPGLAPPVTGFQANPNVNPVASDNTQDLLGNQVKPVITSPEQALDSQRQDTLADHLAYGTPGVLAAAVDTVGRSVGILKSGDVDNFITNYIGKGFGDYYSRNKEPLQLTADLATFAIPATFGAKAIQSGSWLYRLTQADKVPQIAKLFASAGDASALTQGIRDYDLARAGKRAIDFVSNDPVRDQLVTSVYKSGVADAMKKYLASETAVYLTMNQSENFYPSDWKFTDYLLTHGVAGGLTAGIETAFLRSAMRRSLQRPEVMNLVSKAINPLGLPDTIGMPGERDLPLTVAAVAASEQRNVMKTTDDYETKTFANRYALSWDGQAKTSIEGIYKDGLPGIVSPNRTNNKGTQTILSAVQANPTIGKGIRALDDMPAQPDAFDDITTKLGTEADRLDAKINRLMEKDPVANADEIAAATDQRDTYRSLVPAIIEPTGDIHRPDEVGIVFHNLTDPPAISTKAATTVEDSYLFTKVKDPYTGETSRLGLTKNLLPLYPTNKKWTDLTRFQQSTMFAMGQKLIDTYEPGKLITGKIQLNEKSDPFVLGLARELLQTQPKALADFQFPAGVAGKETEWIDNQWLQNSYSKTFVPMMDRFVGQGKGTVLTPNFLKLKLDDIRYALNMPASYLGDQHPAFKLFRSFYMSGDRTLDTALAPGGMGVNMGHFQGMMKEEQRFLGDLQNPDTVQFLRSAPISPFGDNLHYPTAKDGSFLPAQVAFLKPQKYDMTKTSMDLYALGKKMEFQDKFKDAPDFVKNISRRILGSSAYDTAKQVDTLANGQQAGSGFITYQNMATRDINVFTAADQISSIIENGNRTTQKAIWDVHKDAFLGLQKDDAARFHFNQFVQARRYGFELEREVEQGAGENGTVRFVLKRDEDAAKGTVDHTTRNVAAWKRAFGPDAVLPDANEKVYLPEIIGSNKALASGMDYLPLSINQTAFAGVAAFRDISDTLWKAANFFRGLYNKGNIGYQEWHVPPQNVSNKFVKYIVSPTQEGTDGAVRTLITGNTPQELARKIQKPAIQSLLERGGKTEEAGEDMAGLLIDENDMRNYFDLHDDAFFSMVDMSDGLAQTGASKGVTASPLLEYGQQAINDMITSVERQLTMYSRRTVSSLFKDQINYARMADGASEVASAQPKGVKGISIWKQYYSRLLGIPAQTPAESVINAEVPLINKYLTKLTESVGGFLPKRTTDVTKWEEADFNGLKKALGDTLPFSDAADFAANTFKVRKPKTIEDVSGALNAITANTVLRVLEVGNGLASITGNLVSMPLVMNSLKRNKWDTDQSWQARTGFMGAAFTGKDFAMPNPVRMMAKSIGFLFSKEGQEMIDEARMAGNIKPMMAEGYKTLHSPFEGPIKKSLNKFVDSLSIVSDKGEEWSRIWAYSAGYQIAKYNGMTNKYDMHNIANLFADNTIANYRASNKPLAFQGALGAPLGLFQTYMWNYYGRMFRYIENKDYRSLAIQYAMQSSVFGLQTVPGWHQFQQLHSFAWNGKHDVVDSLDNAYGNTMTDGILYGSLSNIPRLFSKDGVALYSRGDVNLTRTPAIIDPANMPFLNLMTNAYDLLGGLFSQVREGGQGGMQRTLETIGTYSINRPISRIAELLAGVSADQRGNVLNEDTRSALSFTSRLMGMRPLIEQKNMQTYARMGTTEGYQEAIHERIDNSLRALFRGNPSQEQLANGIAKGISDHLSYGGSPYSVADYIRNVAISAQVTKNTGKLMELLHSPGRVNDLLRLVNAMTDYGDGN